MSREILDEVSGVFEAELLEDMMDTVKRVKKPFIDCKVPAVLDNETHPLTYVPAIFMTYPLKKGDKVIVRFNQDNFRYPVVWKIPTQFGDKMLADIEFPESGKIVSFPAAEKVVAVKQITEDYYVYITDKYTLVRTGDQFTLISPDGETINVTTFQVLANDILLEAKNDYKVLVSKAISIKSSGNSTLEIGNSVATLGALFSSLFDELNSIMDKLSTMVITGTAGETPVTAAPDEAWVLANVPEIKGKIIELKTKTSQVFSS